MAHAARSLPRLARGARWACVASLVAGVGLSALASENLDTEKQIGELRVADRRPASDAGDDRAALLPILAYSPDEGVSGGVKLVEGDFTRAHLALDVFAVYAQQRQQELDLVLAVPRLFGERWLGIVEASYFKDPTKEFFGLGNDDARSELSTNEIVGVNVLLTLGFRLSEDWTLAASAGVSHAAIDRGRLEGDPATAERFPDLVGVHGGYTNPLSMSLSFDDREDLTRPTRGEYLIAKIQHVDPLFGGRSRYTRFIADGSLLWPIAGPQNVLGLRVGGEYIEGGARKIPFYELAPLGSSTDLRGYLLDRFLGRARVFTNVELRHELCEFAIRDWWKARLDLVPFADVGRVFFSRSDVKRASGEASAPPPRLVDTVRVSYGGGLRLALSEALVIRLDVGFSAEETALVYFDFGQAF